MGRNPFGRPDDGSTEMSRETLDDWTVERLLRGAVSPDDAPPGYGGVATLLDAARTEARTAPAARAEDTIAAMVAAAGRAPAIAVVPRRRSVRAKVATAASAGVLALSGVTAAGALPNAAQQHVSTVLAKVGIDVPEGNGGKGRSRTGAHAPGADDETGGAGTATNHGECVSEVAGSGGAQVSAVARSDCGKPSTAGGPQADATHGAVPPGQVKPDDSPKPTHPPQSSSGGPNGNGNGPQGNGNGNGNGNAGGPNGTSQGNGQNQGANPTPPGPGHESNPPANPSPPGRQK